MAKYSADIMNVVEHRKEPSGGKALAENQHQCIIATTEQLVKERKPKDGVPIPSGNVRTKAMNGRTTGSDAQIKTLQSARFVKSLGYCQPRRVLTASNQSGSCIHQEKVDSTVFVMPGVKTEPRTTTEKSYQNGAQVSRKGCPPE